MMPEMKRHTYENKPTRYYIDNKRVSKAKFNLLDGMGRNYSCALTVKKGEGHYCHSYVIS